MQCLTWLLLFAFAVFVMVSLLRWFEQTSDAVERREWDKVALLVAVPFSVWFYSSRVAAGRPTAVPPHEPARGFGVLPKNRPAPAAPPDSTLPFPLTSAPPPPSNTPPPGTPKEFLGMPVVPPKSSRPPRPPVDPDKLAKLRQKMREQGMLDDDQA